MFEKILGEAKGIFNIVTIIDFIISILYILVGLILFSSPDMSIVAASIFTGLLLIASSISSIYSYIKRGSIVLYNNNLVYGIILLIIGIVALFLGSGLSIILGIYFIVSGIQRMNYGFFLKKFNESSWLLTFVVGILFIVIAVVSFFTSLDFVVKVVGVGILGFGMINLINTLLLRKRSKYFIA